MAASSTDMSGFVAKRARTEVAQGRPIPTRQDPFEPSTPKRARGEGGGYRTPRTPDPGGDDAAAEVAEDEDRPQRSGIWWNVARTLEVKVFSFYREFTPGAKATPTVLQMMGSTVGGNYIQGPDQGSAVNQRIGNVIMLRRLHVRAQLLYDFNNGGSAAKGDNLMRVVLFWNNQPSQSGSTSAMSYSDVFDTGATSDGLLNDLFVSRTASYTPFYDKTFRAVSVDNVATNNLAVARIPFELDIPVYKKMRWNGNGLVNLAPCMAICDWFGTAYIQFKIYAYFSDC